MVGVVAGLGVNVVREAAAGGDVARVEAAADQRRRRGSIVSLLVHVTVSPASVVMFGGTKYLAGMSTTRSAAGAPAGATASASGGERQRAPHFFTR